MTTWKIDILKSPGTFDLSVAFFKRTPAKFTVSGASIPSGQHLVDVILGQLTHEDGSGKSFLFQGYTTLPSKTTSTEIKGHFNTRTGKGLITFETK